MMLSQLARGRLGPHYVRATLLNRLHERPNLAGPRLFISRQKSPICTLENIRSSVAGNPVASDTYERWLQYRQRSLEPSETELELNEAKQKNADERAERDESWIAFMGELRGDSARIAGLRIPAKSDLNPDLLSLWRLLDGASGGSQFAIDSVAPLERIAGLEVAQAARDGLIAHWRNSVPRLRSQRDPEAQNRVLDVDLMGIVGVTLEAKTQDRWAEQLSAQEATLAAKYATLELNGFPPWLHELATAKPGEARAVLLTEVLAEISDPQITHFNTLGKIVHAEDGIAAIVAPDLLDDLQVRENLPLGALSQMLRVIVRGILPQDVTRFVQLGMERFENATDLALSNQYLAAVFSLDSVTAVRGLIKKLETLEVEEQTVLVDCFIVLTFGHSVSSGRFKAGEVPIETLEQLVRLTFQTTSQATTRRRPAGVVYHVDETDHAEQARSAVFNRLASTRSVERRRLPGWRGRDRTRARTRRFLRRHIA